MGLGCGRYQDSARRGMMITKPTVVRVGESGPEAIVPLNGSKGNHVRTDMLAGQITSPKVPGMRYQKHRNYTNPAY